MSEISTLWRPEPTGEADWLAELADDDGITGFEPPRRPDAAWVLNAMYEHEQGPGPVSHDEVYRTGLTDGSIRPVIVAGINFDEEVNAVVTGGGLGRAEHPGPGWRRLRWADLARRCGDPIVPEGLRPSYRCLPSARKEDGSWPAGIAVPTEGSLDRETWNRLIELLVEHSPAGPDTRCLAYYNPLMLGAIDLDARQVLAGRVGDAGALYDNPEVEFSPSNLWPEDRSWIVHTDYDLWGSKVAGSVPLIEALLSDAEIEAVRLPWTP
jgi:hypothetical protein